MSDVPAFLSTMFSDTRFQRFGRYIYYAVIDDKKIGVVLATMAPHRDDFALNKGEFERVLNGERDGKVNQAFVVAAKLNGGRSLEYQGADRAEAVLARLGNLRTFRGVYGEFWSLQLYDIIDDPPL